MTAAKRPAGARPAIPTAGPELIALLGFLAALFAGATAFFLRGRALPMPEQAAWALLAAAAALPAAGAAAAIALLRVSARNRAAESGWARDRMRIGELEDALAAEREASARVRGETKAAAEVPAGRDARIARAEKSQDRFLRAMEHEARTSLHGILGPLSLLLESRMGAGQTAHASVARAGAECLLAWTDSVLEFRELESGRLSLDRSLFDAEAVCAEAVGILEPLAARKGIKLELDCPKGMARRVAGDSRRFRRMAVLLLRFALESAGKGSLSLAVRWAEQGPEDGLLRLAVTGTALTANPERLQRAFRNPLGEADDAEAKGMPPALGPSALRLLADRMGGTARATGGDGASLQFTARLGRIPEPRPSRASRSVLLADDNPVSLMVAVQFLEKEGCPVTVVSDGAEAVKEAASGDFGIVLMDISMPGMDGLEATAAIRKLPDPARSVPILALTAKTRADDRLECERAGMDGFLAKPLSQDELHEALGKWLGKDHEEHPARAANPGGGHAIPQHA